MQYTFVTKFLPVDFEGTLYNSVGRPKNSSDLHKNLLTTLNQNPN